MNRQLTFITLVFFLTASAWASEPAVYTGLLSNTGAGGYDTVSYFEANPERYLPAYGGYCAWAVAQGYLAKGDPQHWAIRDGRLYLNYNESVQDRWLKDTEGFIRQADANWPKILE
jgi:hypothetical protein